MYQGLETKCILSPVIPHHLLPMLSPSLLLSLLSPSPWKKWWQLFVVTWQWVVLVMVVHCNTVVY